MTTIDDFIARLESAPGFQQGAVLWIKVEELPDPTALRELTSRLRERCGVELIITQGDLQIEELPQASDRELFEALNALRRQPSVQDQVDGLKKQYVFVRRDKLAGA